ncbi:hypothetical protein B0T17DRAFT_393361 [Bombardia bombarda]|uniref:Uncharacterized protein n=1 Tax=Bombardia bombarda TaxID=252184 RepID=A0AA39U7U6_9PEZI|nr:hypothetical protein B0T17DRAFT_393361 [Bombardia bombarda]
MTARLEALEWCIISRQSYAPFDCTGGRAMDDQSAALSRDVDRGFAVEGRSRRSRWVGASIYPVQLTIAPPSCPSIILTHIPRHPLTLLPFPPSTNAQRQQHRNIGNNNPFVVECSWKPINNLLRTNSQPRLGSCVDLYRAIASSCHKFVTCFAHYNVCYRPCFEVSSDVLGRGDKESMNYPSRACRYLKIGDDGLPMYEALAA